MKPLSECTNDELDLVFNRNSILRQQIEDDLQESEMDYITDNINCFRNSLSNYSIGFYQHNFIRVSDSKEFIKGVITATEMYGFLSDDRIAEINEKLIIIGGIGDDDTYETAEEELAEKVSDYTLDTLCRITDPSNLLEYMPEYFKEFYKDERMEVDSFFVDDDYTLFEHVDFMKSYK